MHPKDRQQILAMVIILAVVTLGLGGLLLGKDAIKRQHAEISLSYGG